MDDPVEVELTWLRAFAILGGYGSYILPAAAVGAMGYCYMKWKASVLCCSLYLLAPQGYLLYICYESHMLFLILHRVGHSLM